MTQLSRRHPRYLSLRVRAGLARAFREGLVVPEGLVAHGRGEAFDYLLGERTTAAAWKAERLAARWLHDAQRPVLSVNGNVASLASNEIARLQRALPRLRVEVNLFHRTEARARAIARRLRRAGVTRVLGLRPGVRIPGLSSDRAWVDAAGIAVADVALVPLEDGDRTAALRRLRKRVISIDLNPLSRSSRDANLPVVDELTRALDHIAREAERLDGRRRLRPARPARPSWLRAEAIREIRARLTRAAARGEVGPPPWPRSTGPRPVRGTARRSRRRR
jgi:4-phosphopantoate---beta-alanine ligase